MILMMRRGLLGSVLAVGAAQAWAQGQPEYAEYPFRDVFAGANRRGPGIPSAADIAAASRIAAKMPQDDPYKIMQALAGITEVGTTGEAFNYRWKRIANPLIVKFFHDIGYSRTPYPGDCTPWCAATVSWCLKRASRGLPPDPASSQSFLSYRKVQGDPLPGDVCVFTDVGDSSHGHVGLFVSRTADAVKILGGNQLGVAATGCGPGFRASRIDYADLPVNPTKDRAISVHYLSAVVRPT